MAVPPPSLSPPPIETTSAVRAAIDALTPEERKSLRRYACWRMLPIRGTVHHSDQDDLYNEAVRRTLDGTREWHSAERTMFKHLIGVISSVADEWYKEMKRYGELSDVHATPGDIGGQVARKMLIQRIKRKLTGDAMAAAVFASLLNDEKPSEAIERLNIPKKVYEAARRRVLRHGRRLLLQRGSALS